MDVVVAASAPGAPDAPGLSPPVCSMLLLWMMVCCMRSMNHQHWVSCSCCCVCCISWLRSTWSTPSAEATNDLGKEDKQRINISPVPLIRHGI